MERGKQRVDDLSGRGNGISRVQRSRIVAAMLDVACGQGAAAVTVAPVVARAGVSRRTFYETFANVEECLLAAIDHALQVARGYLLAAHDPAAPWQARMRAGIEGFLSFLDYEPKMGRLLVVEWLGAGPQALERRASALAPIIDAIDQGRTVRGAPAGLSTLTAEGLVGSVLSVLHARLLDGHENVHEELSSPIVSMIVRPYMGAAAAQRELSRPASKSPRQVSSLVPLDRLTALPMRLTYRTMRVLSAIAEHPGASNRKIGAHAGIDDQGQISKLLGRLQRLGLISNEGSARLDGGPNAWTLTTQGAEIQSSIAASAA